MKNKVTGSLIGNGRKPKNIKVYNQRLVLSFLREHGTSTVGEIADCTNLSITTVVKILQVLQENQIVKSIGKGESTGEGGKKPQLYELNKTYKYAIGCMLEDKLYITLTDLSCGVIEQRIKEISNHEEVESTFQDVAEAVREIVADNNLLPEAICGIAIGIDGIVNADAGSLYYSVWRGSWGTNIPVIEKLRALLPEFEHFHMDNSGRYGSYALFLTHPEYRNKTFFNLFLGDGSVGCLIKNGQIERGSSGLVGEIGYIRILLNENGSGKATSFDEIMSPEMVMKLAVQLSESFTGDKLAERVKKKTCDYQEIFMAADDGNLFARKVVDQLVVYFSFLICNIIVTCDPQIVTLSGYYGQAGQYFSTRLVQEIREVPFLGPEMSERVHFLKDVYGQNSMGGALYAIDQYFKEIEFN